MTDTFKSHVTSLSDPIETAQNVLPDDTTDLMLTSRAVYVGGAGNLRVTLASGSEVTFAAGQGWHPIRVSRVWSTGTTATAIVACA